MSYLTVVEWLLFKNNPNITRVMFFFPYFVGIR